MYVYYEFIVFYTRFLVYRIYSFYRPILIKGPFE